MSSAIARVVEIAADQWGLVTTAQAEHVGVSRLTMSRLAAAGVLERLEYGAYAVAASPYEQQPLRAAWLALEPWRTAAERRRDKETRVVASHTSAASLFGLGDLLDDVHEFTVNSGLRTRRAHIRLYRQNLQPGEVMLSGGMPVTTPERTVHDLLNSRHAGADLHHIADIISAGLDRGLMTVDSLAPHLDTDAPRLGEPDGTTLIESLLDRIGQSEAAKAVRFAKSRAGMALMETVAHEAIASTVSPSLIEMAAQMKAMIEKEMEALPAPVISKELRKALTEFAKQTAAIGQRMSPLASAVPSELFETAARMTTFSKEIAAQSALPAIPEIQKISAEQTAQVTSIARMISPIDTLISSTLSKIPPLALQSNLAEPSMTPTVPPRGPVDDEHDDLRDANRFVEGNKGFGKPERR